MTSNILAILTSLAFFGTVALVTLYPIHPESRDIVYVLLGTLGSGWMAVIGYHFGSSRGSARKTELLQSPRER